MNERFFDHSSSIVKNNKEFNSQELAKLSKDEILDLVKNLSYSDKKDILKKIPNQVYWPSGIDQGTTEDQEMSDDYGFRVGSVEIGNRETGEIAELNLYCKREEAKKTGSADASGQNLNGANAGGSRDYKYIYSLIDGNGSMIAYIMLDDYSEDRLDELPSSFRNLSNYTGDAEGRPESFTYVDVMFVNKEKREASYSGCGTALHQVAVEHSLRNGFEGRAQLCAESTVDFFSEESEGGEGLEYVTSTGFHENFGYFYKDVYDDDGALLHGGQEIHQALAENRWEDAQKWKMEHPEEKIPRMRDTYRAPSGSDLYAFLPEQTILREKERMLKHQNLQVNLETLAAMEEGR